MEAQAKSLRMIKEISRKSTQKEAVTPPANIDALREILWTLMRHITFLKTSLSKNRI
jgi:hypothetical protein